MLHNAVSIIPELVYRPLFLLFGLAMMAIWLHYQKKSLPNREETTVKGNPVHLLPGIVAALTTIIFSLEYIVAPRTFVFAYPVNYPDWLRIAGALLLGCGILLLWAPPPSRPQLFLVRRKS